MLDSTPESLEDDIDTSDPAVLRSRDRVPSLSKERPTKFLSRRDLRNSGLGFRVPKLRAEFGDTYRASVAIWLGFLGLLCHGLLFAPICCVRCDRSPCPGSVFVPVRRLPSWFASVCRLRCLARLECWASCDFLFAPGCYVACGPTSVPCILHAPVGFVSCGRTPVSRDFGRGRKQV